VSPENRPTVRSVHDDDNPWYEQTMKRLLLAALMLPLLGSPAAEAIPMREFPALADPIVEPPQSI
jgi:hypothetical protein